MMVCKDFVLWMAIIVMVIFMIAHLVYYITTLSPCLDEGGPCEREKKIDLILSFMWGVWPMLAILGIILFFVGWGSLIVFRFAMDMVKLCKPKPKPTPKPKPKQTQNSDGEP